MSLATDLIARLIADEGPMADLRQRAAHRPKRVVLCEGEDPRVVAAALALRELGLARPLLIGDPGKVREEISGQGADPGLFEVIATDDSRTAAVAELLFERRKSRGLKEVTAQEVARSPLPFGGRTGRAGDCGFDGGRGPASDRAGDPGRPVVCGARPGDPERQREFPHVAA